MHEAIAAISSLGKIDGFEITRQCESCGMLSFKKDDGTWYIPGEPEHIVMQPCPPTGEEAE
jgi:hypothetical protein